MESITENIERVGNFTSSCMVKLTTLSRDKKSFGAPALTYISEKNMERRFGVSLGQEKYSRSTLWGHFLEQRVHNLLGTDYESVGHITLGHPAIDFWKGSPDNKNIQKGICGDTKCFERKAFAEYVDMLVMANGDTEIFKAEAPKEYWQLVSNAIILGMKYIQPIVYMPYESELEEIREMAYNYDGPDQFKFRFIAEAPISELPYLKDGGFYKNLNIFLFEVPQSDIDYLTSTVLAAGKLLQKFHKIK